MAGNMRDNGYVMRAAAHRKCEFLLHGKDKVYINLNFTSFATVKQNWHTAHL